MMHKKPTSGWMRLAYVAILPFLAGTMFLCNPARAEFRSSAAVDMPAAPTGQVIEKAPTFRGEDASAFSKWFAENMNYPKEARENGIQGRVLVGFDICEDGVIRNVKVLRGAHELLDAEAVRVISASPKWEPGTQDGKPVKVAFSFPVVFRLTGENQSAKSLATEQEKPAAGNETGGVVVVSYPNPATIQIRGNGEGDPIIYLDGKKFDGTIGDIDPSKISSIEVLKDEDAVKKYGEEAKNGVLLISTKK